MRLLLVVLLLSSSLVYAQGNLNGKYFSQYEYEKSGDVRININRISIGLNFTSDEVQFYTDMDNDIYRWSHLVDSIIPQDNGFIYYTHNKMNGRDMTFYILSSGDIKVWRFIPGTTIPDESTLWYYQIYKSSWETYYDSIKLDAVVLYHLNKS